MNAKNNNQPLSNYEEDLYNLNIFDSLMIVKSSIHCMKTVMLRARNNDLRKENSAYFDILDDEMEVILMEYQKLELLGDYIEYLYEQRNEKRN